MVVLGGDTRGCTYSGTNTWLYLAVPGCAWLYLAVPGCAWLYLAVPGYTWLYLTVPGYTWLYLAVPGYTWLYLAIPGCTCQETEFAIIPSQTPSPLFSFAKLTIT